MEIMYKNVRKTTKSPTSAYTSRGQFTERLYQGKQPAESYVAYNKIDIKNTSMKL